MTLAVQLRIDAPPLAAAVARPDAVTGPFLDHRSNRPLTVVVRRGDHVAYHRFRADGPETAQAQALADELLRAQLGEARAPVG